MESTAGYKRSSLKLIASELLKGEEAQTGKKKGSKEKKFRTGKKEGGRRKKLRTTKAQNWEEEKLRGKKNKKEKRRPT